MTSSNKQRRSNHVGPGWVKEWTNSKFYKFWSYALPELWTYKISHFWIFDLKGLKNVDTRVVQCIFFFLFLNFFLSEFENNSIYSFHLKLVSFWHNLNGHLLLWLLGNRHLSISAYCCTPNGCQTISAYTKKRIKNNFRPRYYSGENFWCKCVLYRLFSTSTRPSLRMPECLALINNRLNKTPPECYL